MQKIHLITYGNHVFTNAKKRLLNDAIEFNEFETITGYGPEDLPENFKTTFKDILNLQKGGGYWIWKTIIISEKLKLIKDNDILIYLDSGCKLNPLGKQRFAEYIQLLNNSEYGIISFQMPNCIEKNYTTIEIFNYFNIEINSDIANNGQYVGGILIMKKNTHLLKIMDLYTKALYDNPLLFTDHYNINQHKEFIANRHDQSVFSIIRKIHGSVIIDNDESWIIPFGNGESLKYPIWATRLRN